MFNEKVDEYKESIINTLSDLIKIPSVSEEVDLPDSPFGENCNKVLDKFLTLAENLGFKTKNINNYCGYVEFGEGKELVGIIGHLDVVPALDSDGWTTPPFEPSIRNGNLYGRGSIDDKGPVVASLYAMKVIMDTCKVSKRVRLIVGLNEEKSWKCINYYKEHEEHPTIGFSPDANFPGIYAEKGILSISLSHPFNIKDYKIIDISTNNNAINVVPKYASITLQKLYNNPSNLKESDNIHLNEKEDIIKIEAFGKASHAAHPEEGINAIEILTNYLCNNFEFDTDYLNTLNEIGLFDTNSPKFINEQIQDESGILTSNVACISYIENNLDIRINLRIPVTYKISYIVEKYNLLKSNYPNLIVTELSRQEPLYIEKDNYLVKTLVDIFNKETNTNTSPIAIGGGTYARAFDNFISYGATMPGKKDMCHQVDEFINIDELILTSKIYAKAIYELAK